MGLFPKLEIRRLIHPLSAAPVNKRATRILPKDCIRGAYYRAIDLTLTPVNHHEKEDNVIIFEVQQLRCYGQRH